MIFSGHSRSLHLLRSSSDDSLTTSQDAEVDQRDRRYTSPQADTRSRTEKATPWFVSQTSEKETLKAEASMRSEWPNGPPPSGPRSHRVAISPPAIARFSNASEHVQRLSDHDVRTSFTRQSYPSSVQWRRIDTSPTVSRSIENVSKYVAAHISVSAEETGKAAHDPKNVVSTSTTASLNHSLGSGQSTTSTLPKEVLWMGELDENESLMTERDGKPQPDSFSMHLDVGETPQLEPFFKVSQAAHFSPLPPNQQIAHLDETASVVSDVTISSGAAVSGQSSTTSGSRTRTCHKCKKPALTTSPLFRCAECPRRYHPHCAVPKISSSSQASGALDWICNHCVKHSQGNEISATGSPSIQQNLVGKTDLPSEFSPIKHSGTKARMPASLTHHSGSHATDTQAVEARIIFAEAPCNGHQQAPADLDSSQAARNSSNQSVPSNPEQLEGSASDLSPKTSKAIAMKEDAMGGVSSAFAFNNSNSPLRQASTEEYWSIDIYSPPHILVETDLDHSPGEVVDNTHSTTINPPATNGFRQQRRLELPTSPSVENATHRTSRFGPDADSSEDGALTSTPKRSLEKVQSASHATTSTGRLPQPQETAPPKIEIQSSRKALKRLTCYYWKQRGGCRYRDDECQYAHYDTGLDEGKNTTCFWWWTFGHCKKSERECLYAHRDTGLYAKPPPGYIPPKRPHVQPRSPDRFTKNGRADHYSPPLSPEHMRSPIEDLSTRRSPPLRPAVLSSSIPESSWHPPSTSNTNGATSNKVEHRVIGVDPRLSRRPSSMSVDNCETFLTTSKADVNTISTAAPNEPITPGPRTITATEPSSSFNKCRACEKKVFGSASLCFTCKGTKPATSKAVIRSSPFVPETPKVGIEMTPEVGDQPAPEAKPPTPAGKPASVAPNPLKRMNSVLEPGIDTSMFIKKKARIFKPSEPRRTSIETSPPQVDSPSAKDKTSLPPRPTAAVDGILTKAPVALEELIELERLRKQVALLEKSNTEEKRAYDEARRLHAEERDRADMLSEELQALKVRNREVIKPDEEAPKKAAVPVAQSKKEQDYSVNGDTARVPQMARRSRGHPTFIRRQSCNDFDRPPDPRIQSPVRLRAIRIDTDKTKLLRDMRERGIVFESDDESDDGPEVPPPTPVKLPKDPLWHPPKSSRDLFQVSPQYQQENLFFDLEAKKKEIAARLSRKQTFGRVLELSGQKRSPANVHREVDRRLPSRMIKTRVADGSGELDPFNEMEQTKEVEMTCEEFFGVPENALFCLTTTQQLAYRDGALDRWGKLPRVPDDEKFEIGV